MINTFKIICRFREIHVVNEYGVFQAVYALVGKKSKDMWSKYDWLQQVRPFLTEKICNRLQFHGCCFHNLHRSLGKPVLPSEYGGDQVAIAIVTLPLSICLGEKCWVVSNVGKRGNHHLSWQMPSICGKNISVTTSWIPEFLMTCQRSNNVNICTCSSNFNILGQICPTIWKVLWSNLALQIFSFM